MIRPSRLSMAMQAGRTVAPADIAVGEHTLRGIVMHPDHGPFEDLITFHVDPPDSDTCTGN